jgi:hypothetical protein
LPERGAAGRALRTPGGVAKSNPNGMAFHLMANRHFQELYPYTGY